MLSAICGLAPVAFALTLSLVGGVLCHTHEKGAHHFNTTAVPLNGSKDICNILLIPNNFFNVF
jgi:hypothetical protein